MCLTDLRSTQPSWPHLQFVPSYKRCTAEANDGVGGDGSACCASNSKLFLRLLDSAWVSAEMLLCSSGQPCTSESQCTLNDGTSPACSLRALEQIRVEPAQPLLHLWWTRRALC